MIVFELMPTIDEGVFDSLYNESVDILNSGSYPWALFGITVEEEKQAHMRRAFDNLIFQPNGFGWQVRVDGEVLLICAGTQNSDLITWDLGLCGTRNGSRSWLYDPDYEPARNVFWASRNVRGWIMSHAGDGKSVYNHVMSKVSTGNLLANVETSPSGIPGFTNIIVTNK